MTRQPPDPLVSGPLTRPHGNNAPASLGTLPLSRASVDRATMLRADESFLARAWDDPRTRVLVVDGGRALVRIAGGDYELVLVPPAQAPGGTRFFLGTDDDGVAYFGVSGQPPAAPEVPAGAQDGASAEHKVLALRSVGADLPARDAGLLTHAVALANWHDSHTHCPQCGTPTVPATAGHFTRCPADGTEHFPRLDPAVIMLVIDPDDRLLLARNAAWPPGRMSVLAGFVEPGESLEAAVAREVFEEASVIIDEVEYLGSQPWPMPRSLMLGFRAVTAGAQQIHVDEEEIGEARWFTRAELIAAIEAREVGLAPTSSIARRLIEHWYGGPLPDYPGGWGAPGR